MDSEQLRPLMRQLGRRALWQPTADAEVQTPDVPVEQLLPHRPPFLLIDRISAFDDSVPRVQAERWLDPSDPVFAGHFPGSPVYPGVLLVEAMAQTGVAVFGLRTSEELAVRVTRIHHAVFFAAVQPGDTLTFTAEILEEDSLTALVVAQAMRGDQYCAACVLEAYLA